MVSYFRRVLLDAIWFGVIGAFHGAFIGAVNGALAGTAFILISGLVYLVETARGAPAMFSGSFILKILWESICAVGFYGSFGGIIGVAVGVATCIPTWAIIGAVHWKRPDQDVTQHLARGTMRASLLMTFAGASSGVLFHSTWLYTTQNANNALQMSLNPLGGGFFWGSIIGCAFGLFSGAIFGARPVRSWLNVPTREVPSEIRDGVLKFVQTR